MDEKRWRLKRSSKLALALNGIKMARGFVFVFVFVCVVAILAATFVGAMDPPSGAVTRARAGSPSRVAPAVAAVLAPASGHGRSRSASPRARASSRAAALPVLADEAPAPVHLAMNGSVMVVPHPSQSANSVLNIGLSSLAPPSVPAPATMAPELQSGASVPIGSSSSSSSSSAAAVPSTPVRAHSRAASSAPGTAPVVVAPAVTASSADLAQVSARMDAMQSLMQQMLLTVTSRPAETPALPSIPRTVGSNSLNLAAAGYRPPSIRDRTSVLSGLTAPPPLQRTASARVRFDDDEDILDLTEDESDDDPSSPRQAAGLPRSSRDRLSYQRLLEDPIQHLSYASTIFHNLGGYSNLRQAFHQRTWRDQGIRRQVDLLIQLLDARAPIGESCPSTALLNSREFELIARRLGGLWHADIHSTFAVADQLGYHPGDANASPLPMATLAYLTKRSERAAGLYSAAGAGGRGGRGRQQGADASGSSATASSQPSGNQRSNQWRSGSQSGQEQRERSRSPGHNPSSQPPRDSTSSSQRASGSGSAPAPKGNGGNGGRGGSPKNGSHQ